MANAITDDCIGCGNCEIECIHGAIFACGEAYAIDPARCDGCVDLPCGCRCMRVCPTEAIVRSAAAGIAAAARAVPVFAESAVGTPVGV